LGDRSEDQSEHTPSSLTAGISTTAHDQRRQFAFGVAVIPFVDQHGALSDGSVVKIGQGANVRRILKRVRKHGGGGLQRNDNGSCGFQKSKKRAVRESLKV
jgi:hypothetical protein